MTQTTDCSVSLLAERLLSDYDRRAPGGPFADGLRLSIDDACRVQSRVASLREERAEQVVGYKIGCVCEGNQRRNGLSEPVFGRLWSTEQHENGVTLAKDDFANVAIEGEFAVTLGRDLGPNDTSVEAVAEAVDQVFTVIELHHLVFHSDHPRGPELIANNAIHAGVIRSEGTDSPSAATLADLSIDFDGRRVDEWDSLRWPNDMLQAVPWLIEKLAGEGLTLRRGQTILTGAWGPPLPLDGRRPVGQPENASGWDNGEVSEQDGESFSISHVTVTSAAFGSVAASFS